MSLWDIAIETNKNKKKEDNSDVPLDSTILFVGNKNSGKSTIIMRFLDRPNEPTKPTVALEYTFGRRARGNNIVKDVANIWELGGGIWLAKLIDYAITPESILDLTLTIVVDLSQPADFWYSIETLLKTAKARIKFVLDSLPDEVQTQFKRKMADRLKDHSERDLMDPFPVPLIFIGGKYDLFKELPADQKKLICKTLRFLNHYYGGSLQFFSVKEEALISRSRAIISHSVFGTSENKQLQVEHSKPLMVPLGMDSFEIIKGPTGSEDDFDRGNARTPLDLWKNAFTAAITQNMQSLIPSNQDNPALDEKYFEPQIDAMRQQKEEELERYRKMSERKMRSEEAVAY